MSQQFSIIPVLYVLGAAHGVFLALALFTHHGGSRRANLYLGLYTLVFVAALCDYFMDLTGLTRSLIGLRVFLWPKEFLYGVLLYFYVRELTAPGKFRIRGRQLWHLAPVFLHMLATWPLFLLPASTQLHILTGEPRVDGLQQAWALLLGDVELVATVFQLTVYLLLSLRLLRRHEERLLHTYSYREKISLAWLGLLLKGTLAVYLVWLADEFLNVGEPLESWLDFGLGLSMVALIYSLSILGLRQPVIFAAVRQSGADPGDRLAEVEIVDEISRQQEQKYRNSALSETLSGELMQTIDQTMERDRLFRDPALSLPQLATTLDLPANYLSQAINQQKNQNFFDYINSYRVREVIRLMQLTPERNVLDLALEAGFNSKSPFYAAFRKNTGQSPGQFRRALSQPDRHPEASR